MRRNKKQNEPSVSRRNYAPMFQALEPRRTSKEVHGGYNAPYPSQNKKQTEMVCFAFWSGLREQMRITECWQHRSECAETRSRMSRVYRGEIMRLCFKRSNPQNSQSSWLVQSPYSFQEELRGLILLANYARRSVAALTVHWTVIHYRSPSSPYLRIKKQPQ